MKNFRSGMIALAVAAAFAGTQAMAADGVLAPGKPAGVREAARRSPNLWVIGGAAVAAVVGVVIATQNSSYTPCGTACTVTPTTTT